VLLPGLDSRVPATWEHGLVVRQRIPNPLTEVRFLVLLLACCSVQPLGLTNQTELFEDLISRRTGKTRVVPGAW
jgi:hypothetical protein